MKYLIPLSVLFGLVTLGSAWAENDKRWVPINSPAGKQYFYDSKSLKPDVFGFQVWLKDQNNKKEVYGLDCKNRLIDFQPIMPESPFEVLFDEFCSPSIPLKPIEAVQIQSQTVDFGPYMAELQRRIRRNWAPDPANVDTVVKASFIVSQDGRVSDIQFQNPLLPDGVLQSAYSAIMTSAPFNKLPTGYTGNSIKIQFVFDYNLYGHGQAAIAEPI